MLHNFALSVLYQQFIIIVDSRQSSLQKYMTFLYNKNNIEDFFSNTNKCFRFLRSVFVKKKTHERILLKSNALIALFCFTLPESSACFSFFPSVKNANK